MPNCHIHTDTELVCPKCNAKKGGTRTKQIFGVRKLRQWAAMGGKAGKGKSINSPHVQTAKNSLNALIFFSQYELRRKEEQWKHKLDYRVLRNILSVWRHSRLRLKSQ